MALGMTTLTLQLAIQLVRDQLPAPRLDSAVANEPVVRGD
jgi:hypothetical protein